MKTFNGCRTVRPRRDILLYAANQEYNDTKYVACGRVSRGSKNFSCNLMCVYLKVTGLGDYVIKFSTYLYRIFKISMKTVTNTQSDVTGFVSNIRDISHLRCGDKWFEFNNRFSCVGFSCG